LPEWSKMVLFCCGFQENVSRETLFSSGEQNTNDAPLGAKVVSANRTRPKQIPPSPKLYILRYGSTIKGAGWEKLHGREKFR
jgi:hypothetical protein